MTPVRDTWPKILAMAFCLFVVAFDDNEIPVVAHIWWPFLYGASGVALLAWRASQRRWLLTTFGALLTVASVARGAMWLAVENRWAAAGVHGLIAILTYGFVRNRPNGEHP